MSVNRIESEKNGYLRNLKTRLKHIDRELQVWLVRSRESGDHNYDRHYNQVNLLLNKSKCLHDKLQQADDTSGHNRMEVETSIRRAWSDLKLAYHSTLRNLQ